MNNTYMKDDGLPKQYVVNGDLTLHRIDAFMKHVHFREDNSKIYLCFNHETTFTTDVKFLERWLCDKTSLAKLNSKCMRFFPILLCNIFS